MSGELRFAIVGLGGIGRTILDLARQTDPGPVACVGVLTRPDRLERDRSTVSAYVPLYGSLAKLLAVAPDVVLECAGQAALRSVGPETLRSGADLIAISSGAFSDARFESEMKQLARDRQRRIIIPAGAIAGADGLAAAKHAGLSQVLYSGRKPPRAWQGTPAEARLDLSGLRSAEVFFEGSAREAARDYPRNANVTATVALAGVGFEQTKVRLIADPGTTMNIHELTYEGAFGRVQVTVEGRPSEANPRTSLLAGLSLWRSLLGHAEHDIMVV